jgi:leader peptidase (prepilin peptidase)/N-methyltransferase
MLSYRLPRDEDVVVKRSRCINCQHSLGVSDLIPLFSWLFHFGKCTYCQGKISLRYPVIETVTTLLTIFIYVHFGLTIIAFFYLLVTLCLLVLIITDFEHYMIPDSVQVALAFLAVILMFCNKLVLKNMLIGMSVTAGTGIILRYVVTVWKKQDSLGWGDIKLMAVAGLFLEIDNLPVFFFISGMLGIIIASMWKWLKKGTIFPFGPALATAMFICLVLPDSKSMFLQSIYHAIELLRLNS